MTFPSGMVYRLVPATARHDLAAVAALPGGVASTDIGLELAWLYVTWGRYGVRAVCRALVREHGR